MIRKGSGVGFRAQRLRAVGFKHLGRRVKKGLGRISYRLSIFNVLQGFAWVPILHTGLQGFCFIPKTVWYTL